MVRRFQADIPCTGTPKDAPFSKTNIHAVPTISTRKLGVSPENYNESSSVDNTRECFHLLQAFLMRESHMSYHVACQSIDEA